MTKILVVEDEEKIARFVELELSHEGYDVDKAADGRIGADLAVINDYDLILLDVMLPELSGLEVLRRVRRIKSTPVILLTARDAIIDKVAGLDAGADDYITKPFAIEELLARIRVALKHLSDAGELPTQEADAGVAGETGDGMPSHEASRGVTRDAGGRPRALRAGAVLLDPDSHEVLVGVEPVDLTNREFEVLHALMSNRNRVMCRDQLVREVCGYDYVGETNVIDVYVRHIRMKIDEPFGIELITTVRGVGYVIRKS
ncbi:two component transcriptional regulator, winged helix family [Coriobacterium glomerans PW2]|uniref:Two component transcriptional regulator, winged helix family n=1 Tax=Coriobacterium glomerans (strain ATCC 49209 / DSM 20642 / JCM 10262 / PW2) TaxID=700015 RepID=F2NAW4_CORGP|nr:response regulator transcription factor [Coriobacterium glomerans]AEB07642.1 two component transcriptional regulator, winged helix family [Coriobacterium glomerans PW2]